MRKQNAGIWLGGIGFIFAGIIFIQSLSLDYYSEVGPGPGMLPLWLSGALLLLYFLYIIRCVKKEYITFGDILPNGGAARKIILILASLALYILVIPYIGFILAGTMLLFILFTGTYKWYYNLLISVAISIVLFWIFGSLLDVPLPKNSWGF
ncbi:hypothetical protein MHOCP_03050 [Moorella humiferrea]|uniref:tripartite tricarboxylate transporter TctB family protein n=1 Tax=Neomoorella humiferrea TaxID=676965 RepID=UPI0030D5D417